MATVFLIGRILLGGFFLYNGVNHFLNIGFMTQYAGGKGVPAPELAVMFTGLLLLIAGASLLLGLYPKIGIGSAALFLIGVTPMMHNFWAVPPDQQMAETVNFAKNLGLLGGTLMLTAVPEPWPMAVPARRRTVAA